MTVNTTSTKITYQGNGATNQWSYLFPGGPDPDLRVFVVDPTGLAIEIFTNLLIQPNPPLGPNPTSIGGTVTYPVSGDPLAIGNQIVIARDVPHTQPTSFANQGIIYQEVIEKALDDVVMQIQQVDESIARSVQIPIAETNSMILPSVGERANKFLAFDAQGNAVATGNSNPITSTNGIRVPNTEIVPELPPRIARPGTIISFDSNGDPVLAGLPPPNLQPLFGQRVTITGPHTVVNEEKGFLFQLSGNLFFDLILGNPTTYDADFSIAVFNGDQYTGTGSGRAKRVMFNGTIMPGGLLWPGQWVYIFRYGNIWVANPRDARWKPGVAPTFFVDPILGHDDGTSDGLAPGAGAIKTVASAVAAAIDRVDYGGILTNFGATVQLAVGVYQETILINFPTIGGNPIIIKGANDGSDPTPYQIVAQPGLVAIHVDASASVVIKGIYFSAGALNCTGLLVTKSSSAIINNCKFGNMSGSTAFHMHIYDSSSLEARDITVFLGVNIHLAVRRQSTARLSGAYTVASSLGFTYFVVAEYFSTVVGGASIFGDPTDFHLVGGTLCTGGRYRVQFSSILNLGDNIADTLPGSLTGTTGGTGPNHGPTDSSNVF